jgi:serine/threonine protein kinase
MGIGEHAHRVFLIDFGLATTYRAAMTHAHMPCAEHNPLTGNAPYASINAHLGLTQSRHDDLEALAYVLIYLVRGSLPWYRPTSSAHRTPKSILAKKTTVSSDALLGGYPDEFKTFLDHARSLDFK